ncbi:MAG: hypothetical protein NC925_01215 [Candidatus Omnitrophica bacterium]|nr:hypothetical protein [Candidatus Omnitrophota bacterium]
MLGEKIIRYFKLLKGKNILGPSYLFVGNDFSLVEEIIKLIICKNNLCDDCWDCKSIKNHTHPDVYVVEPKNLQICIDDIKNAQNFLYLKSFCSGKKVLLIKDAQSFGIEAANAFLKTLEEPPKNSSILICTTQLEGILPTIISRCRKIFLPYSESQPLDFNSSWIPLFFDGKLNFKERSQFSSFLWLLAIIFRNSLIFKLTNSESLLFKNKDFRQILGIFNRAKNININELCDILNTILKIYSVSNNVNEKLALNLLKVKFQKVNIF